MLIILRHITGGSAHDSGPEHRNLRDALDAKVETNRPNPYNLTHREHGILQLVADGQSDKQIADALGVSIYTVNKHVGNILSKMMAKSRTEAGVRALRERLVS